MALRHDATHPRPALCGADHTTGNENEGDILQFVGGEWVSVYKKTAQVVMRPGITNPPEPVLTPTGDGWVYAEN